MKFTSTRERKEEIIKGIVRISEKYNADIEITHNHIDINYPVLGQGSAISEDIGDLIQAKIDFKIKLIPSEQKLEIDL